MAIFFVLGITSCGSLDKAKEMADTAKEKINEKVQEKKEEDNENCIKVLEEKADDYGIDPEGVEITSGGTYVKVPGDTINHLEKGDVVYMTNGMSTFEKID